MNELNVYGLIGRDVKGQTFVEQLKSFSGQPVTVNINSRGGNLNEALDMFNALNDHEGEITMHVKGAALSCGSFLLATANKVIANEASLLMFHEPQVSFSGGREAVKSALDMLDTTIDMVASLYSSRGNVTKDDVLAMIKSGKETWMNASLAKEKGFVDEVIPAKTKVTLDMSETQKQHLPDEYRNLLEPPKRNEKEISMSYLDLAKELKLEAADLTEDTAKDAIMAKFAELSESKKEPEKKEPPKFSKALVTMARENRESKINRLVEEFRITKAVADDLRTEYLTDEALAMALDDDSPKDSFEVTMSALSKNEPFNKPGEKTGIQKLSLDADKNPLIADAERRAKAGK